MPVYCVYVHVVAHSHQVPVHLVTHFHVQTHQVCIHESVDGCRHGTFQSTPAIVASETLHHRVAFCVCALCVSSSQCILLLSTKVSSSFRFGRGFLMWVRMLSSRYLEYWYLISKHSLFIYSTEHRLCTWYGQKKCPAGSCLSTSTAWLWNGMERLSTKTISFTSSRFHQRPGKAVQIPLFLSSSPESWKQFINTFSILFIHMKPYLLD